MKTFETYMPVFSGTYGTIWDEYNPKDSEGEDLGYDEYKLDFKKFLETIGKTSIDYLESMTYLFNKAGILSMEFMSSHSPAYYNFSNDSINITVVLDGHTLGEYIKENYAEFLEEIKDKHTSYDGFMSYHSNNIEDWKEETNNFTDFSENEHYLGFLLNIVCKIEDINEEDLYYDWCESVNEDHFVTIIEKSWDSIDVNEMFKDNVDKIDFSFGYNRILKQEALVEAENFNSTWMDELQESDKIEMLEGIGLTAKQYISHD